MSYSTRVPKPEGEAPRAEGTVTIDTECTWSN